MGNYIEQGKSFLEKKEYTKALEYFQAAIQDDPFCSEAYLFLSECYYMMGHIQQSQSTLYSLLSKDPSNKQAKQRLINIQTTITEQYLSSQTNQSTSQNGYLLNNKKTTPGQKKCQLHLANNKLAKKSKWEWSIGGIISGIIGGLLFTLSMLGIIYCLPIDGKPFDYSFEWTAISFFLLLTIFSGCMILSPKMKPSWKVKNIIFSILGIIITPICIGLLVDNFEKNNTIIFVGIFTLVFVFAPFIKTN